MPSHCSVRRFRLGLIIVSLYLLAVAFYFSADEPAMRLAYPVALLALGGAWVLPWTMAAGFAFSALGDMFGVLGCFVGQMASFAVGHVFFLCWLTGRLRAAKPRGWAVGMPCAVWAMVVMLVGWKVLPHVPDMAIRMGCLVYALLLSGMACLAIMLAASRTTQRPWAMMAALGGVLFVVSDAVLAWNRFVGPIHHSGLIIMVTYYAAQLLLFVAAWRLPRTARAGKP